MGPRTWSVSVLAAALVALGCAAPITLAAAPHDRLTSREYALLTASRAGLQSALSERQPNWRTAARNACLTATYESSTELLSSQKASCLMSVGFRIELRRFNAGLDRCAREAHRRTVLEAVLCRAPLFRQVAQAAAPVHSSDVKARRALVKRGFRGTCAARLGPTAKELRHAGELASSSRRLSGEWQTLIRIDRHQLPVSDYKPRQMARQSALVNRDLRLVLRDFPATDLSSCPHQGD